MNRNVLSKTESSAEVVNSQPNQKQLSSFVKIHSEEMENRKSTPEHSKNTAAGGMNNFSASRQTN
jgi:hypothetical protein